MRRPYWLWAIGVLLVAMVVALFAIDESRTFVLAFFLRIFLFTKKHIVAILAAFFLVKGKFILSLFLKKIAFLSATGLGKRYFIEKVLNHNLKIHFFDYISNDVKRLAVYSKKNFKNFPLIKQVLTGFAFLGSMGFVGKFLGGMLALKVFIAKFWSFLLAIVLKFFTVIIYFFTDYLWGSWIAPIVEILIFSWLLEWMERVPFLKRRLEKIYKFFISIFTWLVDYSQTVFYFPVKRFLKYLARRVKKYIYMFIGYRKVSAWKHLGEVRALSPNKHIQLLAKRKIFKDSKDKKTYTSAFEELKSKKT